MDTPNDPRATQPHHTALIERRQRRIPLPDCPTCQQALRVDVRSTDTLYARCVSCGHRRMVAKPEAAEASGIPREDEQPERIAPHEPPA